MSITRLIPGVALTAAMLAGCPAPSATPTAAGASPAAGASAAPAASASAGASVTVTAPAVGDEITPESAKAKFGAWFFEYAPAYKKGAKWTMVSYGEDMPAGFPAVPETVLTREVIELTATTAKIKTTITGSGAGESTTEEKIPTAADPMPSSASSGSSGSVPPMKFLGMEDLTTAAGTFACAKFEVAAPPAPATDASPAPTTATGKAYYWMAKGHGLVKSISPVTVQTAAGPISFTSVTVLRAYVAGS